MGGIVDAKDIAEAMDEKALEAGDVCQLWGPSLGPVKQRGEHSGLEDAHFGVEGDVGATVEGCSEPPKAFGGLVDAGGNLGAEVGMICECAAEIDKGGDLFECLRRVMEGLRSRLRGSIDKTSVFPWLMLRWKVWVVRSRE